MALASTTPSGLPSISASGLDLTAFRTAALTQPPNAQKAAFLTSIATALGNPIIKLFRNGVTVYQDDATASLVVVDDHLVLPSVNAPAEINQAADKDTGTWLMRLEKVADAGTYLDIPSLTLTEDLDGTRGVQFTANLYAPDDLGGFAYAPTFEVDMANIEVVPKGGAASPGVSRFENELRWGYRQPINGNRCVFIPDRATFRGFDDAHQSPTEFNFDPFTMNGTTFRMNGRRATAAEVTYLNPAPVTGVGTGAPQTVAVNGYTDRASYVYVEVNGSETTNFVAQPVPGGKAGDLRSFSRCLSD